MDSTECNVALLSRLESYLKVFDKVLLVNHFEEVLEGFQNLNWEKERKGKVLVLSSAEDYHTLGKNIEYCKITQWEERALSELYYMYEFSDRFMLITRENQFGSLFNYLETGLLTMSEVLEVLLY